MHSHSTRQNNLYCSLNPKTKWGLSMFYYNSVLMWNKLPESIKSVSSYNCFKKHLKSFLLSKQSAEA